MNCVEEVVQTPRVVSDLGAGKRTGLAPQEVQKLLALSALGWGAKRISRELGCSRNTVREHLRRRGWRPMDVSSSKVVENITAAIKQGVVTPTR